MRAEIIFTIIIMAIVTFLTRFTAPALMGNSRISPWAGRVLGHMPTAILAALIAPAIFAPRGFLALTPENHYLLAGIVAALFAYRRQPPVLTMGAGMAVMLLLRSAVNG